MLEEGEVNTRNPNLSGAQIVQIHNALTAHTSKYDCNVLKLFIVFAALVCDLVVF